MKMIAPVKMGDRIELNITGLGSSGEGVGKYDGFTIFVIGALPGETVAVRILVVKKNYAIGKLDEVIMASEERVKPLCPIFEQCGGCQLEHLSYAGQLKAKREQVQAALNRIGHLDIEVLPVIGADNPWNYRNKMQFPAARNKAGKLKLGCYAAATHSVINTENCYIQKEGNNQVLSAVRSWMEEFRVSAYNEKEGKGLVRHVMSRVGVHTGEIMAVLITSEKNIPHKKELIDKLRAQVPGIVSIVQNINPKATNIVMGMECKTLWGKATITDCLGDLSFAISPLAFFQVNSEQSEKLYAKALEYADLKGQETCVDVYCGTGTISLYMAKKAGKVYGVEIVAPAIENAKENARFNKCDNTEFICGDAAVELPKLLASGVRPEVILVDPPRAGCEEKVLKAIVEVKPQRVVYVSCNPASLARDLAYLDEHGYGVVKAQPVDMFVQTSGVETVALILPKVN